MKRFFCYGPDMGWRLHDTAEAAKAAAESELEALTEDGWVDGDPMNVFWGQVLGVGAVHDEHRHTDACRPEEAEEEDECSEGYTLEYDIIGSWRIDDAPDPEAAALRARLTAAEAEVERLRLALADAEARGYARGVAAAVAHLRALASAPHHIEADAPLLSPSGAGLLQVVAAGLERGAHTTKEAT